MIVTTKINSVKDVTDNIKHILILLRNHNWIKFHVLFFLSCFRYSHLTQQFSFNGSFLEKLCDFLSFVFVMLKGTNGKTKVIT